MGKKGNRITIHPRRKATQSQNAPHSNHLAYTTIVTTVETGVGYRTKTIGGGIGRFSRYHLLLWRRVSALPDPILRKEEWAGCPGTFPKACEIKDTTKISCV